MNMKMADMIFINSNVITMENEPAKAEAVAVKDGVIVFVGDNPGALQLKGDQTEVIDLKRKTLVPGFIESHMHPLMFGINLTRLDCSYNAGIDSIEKLLKAIESYASKAPKGSWIIGWGWDDSKFKEKRNPTRWDLDKVVKDHPIFLKRICVHNAVVNSKALVLAKIDEKTPDCKEGIIARAPGTSVPNGFLQERAMDLVPIPALTFDDYKKGLVLAQKEFAKRGITTVHDMSGGIFGLRACQQLIKENKLNIRLRSWPFAWNQLQFDGMLDSIVSSGIETGFGNDLLNIQGIKFMLDGGIGGRSAAVAEPFENDPGNCGVLYTSEEELAPAVLKVIEAGLRVSIHAIGERAIELALKTYESAASKVDTSSMRNRIEHCALPTAEQIKRIKKLNLVIGSSVGFIYSLGDSYFINLGLERAKRAFPQKTYIENGITAPGNSDCPVCDANPLLGIYGAVTRNAIGGHVLGSEQNISVREALKAFTLDAAFASFEENKMGSIRESKWADMTVLSEDPFKVPSDSLKDIEAELTIMNGKITFSRL